MLSFFPGGWVFALAGVVAAAGPIIIHLLNRRRFRVVQWAAMDFLREALERSKRILHLRDILLMILRTACVLLFGLAMARPYISFSSVAAGLNEPLHAVLLIDNSLSMGYQRLDGTVLDEAKAKARGFIERLPQGSQITVLPLCAFESELSYDPYRTREDALEALDAVAVVDRSAGAHRMVELIERACERAPDLANKRAVLIGDQQAINWPAGGLDAKLKELRDVQVVQVAPDEPENAWIADFKTQHGVADVETPTLFVASVRYEGKKPRPNVQVTLSVDNVPVASQTIDLEPGQRREVTFEYRFDVPTDTSRATFVPATVSIPADPLSADDQRTLVVPVVAALPVIFVDEQGSEEDPKTGRLGETILLRRLMAPVTSRTEHGRQLVQIRHVKIEELDRDLLQDARLVVIAGIQSPAPAVNLLREYVEQGGQLFIAAGGEFDAVAWNKAAWLNGAGILPTALKQELFGNGLSEPGNTPQPFFLDPASMADDYFQLPGNSRTDLADLYRSPLFFKIVQVDMREEVLAAMWADEVKRVVIARTAKAEAEKQAGKELPKEPATWLSWARFDPNRDQDKSPEELASRSQPRRLAVFANREAYLVERNIGRGSVVFDTSGIKADWNVMHRGNAQAIFDRMFRAMLLRGFPERNFEPADHVLLPVEPKERLNRFSLIRPDRPEEPLSVDALGGDVYGVTVRNLADRGIYRVIAKRLESAVVQGTDARLWEVPLAVNGSELESELKTLNLDGLRERLGDVPFRWVAADDVISLEGALVMGQNAWWWIMSIVLCCLLLELVVLGWPKFSLAKPAQESVL
jgi:hypothetical protein